MWGCPWNGKTDLRPIRKSGCSLNKSQRQETNEGEITRIWCNALKVLRNIKTDLLTGGGLKVFKVICAKICMEEVTQDIHKIRVLFLLNAYTLCRSRRLLMMMVRHKTVQEYNKYR